MKIHFIQIVLVLTMACINSACKKELNVYPSTSEVDGNTIVDSKSAASVLNGIYYRFAASGTGDNGAPTTQWTEINQAIPGRFCDMVQTNSIEDEVSTFTLTSQNSEPTMEWNYGYGIVDQANAFLKNIGPLNNIPANVKREMIAEAKFLRAFGNEHLLLYFGQYADTTSKYGIILRNEEVTASDINQPRTGVAAAYSSILSDLDTAIAGLPALNAQIYFANAGCAKLLKARVLINRGLPDDYSQVIALTKDLIGNGPFQLEDSTKDIFLTKGATSKEVMLAIKPYPTQYSQYAIYQWYQDEKCSDSVISLYKNDPRSNWMFNYYLDYNNDQVYLFTKYYSGQLSLSMDLSGQTPLSEAAYAFRLSEAYLLESEAIALSNGDLSKARSLLKTVMLHAGRSDFSDVDNASTPEDLHLSIVKEEMRNFLIENGCDWFALRRLPLSVMKMFNPNIQSADHLIMPIPFSEIKANSQVFQNPGLN